MVRKTLLLAAMSVALTSCYMVPLALIGPATSGFSTASIVQATATTTANYVVKQSTGKTITEHVAGALDSDILQQTYFPKNNEDKLTYYPNKFGEKLYD